MQFRNEEKTVDGNVKGSYGYKDANGMYRMVNYYVDANGFHAKVFSNEVSWMLRILPLISPATANIPV